MNNKENEKAVEQTNLEEIKQEKEVEKLQSEEELDNKDEVSVQENQDEKGQELVKRVAEMEAENIRLLNENKTLNDQLSKIKSEFKQKLVEIDTRQQEIYKGQILLKEKKAQEQLKTKLEELEAKAKADLAEAKKYLIKDQALELINIITQFDKACSYPLQDPTLSKFQRGFQIFVTQFNNLLADLHIEKIVPEIGQDFDANIMECFDETVQDPTKPDNTVFEVIYPGYKLYDRLLKPALVKVVKNS